VIYVNIKTSDELLEIIKEAQVTLGNTGGGSYPEQVRHAMIFSVLKMVLTRLDENQELLRELQEARNADFQE
jgi:hypothetical protein